VTLGTALSPGVHVLGRGRTVAPSRDLHPGAMGCIGSDRLPLETVPEQPAVVHNSHLVSGSRITASRFRPDESSQTVRPRYRAAGLGRLPRRLRIVEACSRIPSLGEPHFLVPLVSPPSRAITNRPPFRWKRRFRHEATVSLLTRSVVEDEHESASQALGEVVGELVSDVGYDFLFGLDSPRKKVGVQMLDLITRRVSIAGEEVGAEAAGSRIPRRTSDIRQVGVGGDDGHQPAAGERIPGQGDGRRPSTSLGRSTDDSGRGGVRVAIHSLLAG